ncbi:hypothetical protein MNBD_GAMMA06-2234 [hydrothermal vent metagenome]|uniref:PEP-CTERM protein-sorting domain-containing protein n=1 Tax=hydrothermal vent metagenome TaxID=652676 RepID=A0A3B0W876_9ZZZZ
MKKFLMIINLLLLTGTSVQAAPIVYLDFDNDGLQDTTTSVSTGDSLTASLYITGIDNSFGGLLSWGIQTQFDNTLLSASSYQIEPQWFLEGVNNKIDNTAGTVDILASAFTGFTGTLKLADIIFDTSIDGLAFINLGNINPDLPNFVGFAGADGHDYDGEITFVNATVDIAAVPVPGALFLFISGLVGLIGFKRRK